MADPVVDDIAEEQETMLEEDVPDVSADAYELPETPETEDEQPDDPSSDLGDDEAVADAVPEISDPMLLAAAGRLGLTADEARSFKTADRLLRFIEGLPAIGAASQQPQEPEAPTALELKLSEEVDGEVKDAFNKLNEFHLGRHKALEHQITQLNNSLQTIADAAGRQQAIATQQTLDSWVDSLDDAWKTDKLFGTGPTGSLPKNSRAYQNRESVITKAAQFEAGLMQGGGAQPDPMEVLELARNWVFRNQVNQTAKASARSELMDKVKKAKRAISPRPKGRAAKPPEKGESAAAEFAETWAAEHGL